jgi:hypothetical protein
VDLDVRGSSMDGIWIEDCCSSGNWQWRRCPPASNRPRPGLALVPSEAAAMILRRFKVFRSKMVMAALPPRSARASRRCRWHTANPVIAASGLPATKRCVRVSGEYRTTLWPHR